MNHLSLTHDCLHLGDGLDVTFLRTLRIPDDGKTYPLPPGLGRFPVRRVDDYASRVPFEWREHGGVFLPMYQREAMWISFAPGVPHAVKVAVGKVCAITGERWSESLSSRPQNYVVAPPQPWLDGIAIKRGVIRQFVAMPLGMGYTVEGQVTGDESVGGLQLKVFAPKPGRVPPLPGLFGGPPCATTLASPYRTAARACAGAGAAMGLSAGGRMKQSIYPDPHGIDTWDEGRTSRVFVHIVNSTMWREITGEEPPASPITARDYAAHHLPWFEVYDEGLGALDATSKLAGVKSVKEIDAEKSTLPLQDDESVNGGPIKKLWGTLASIAGVRDGKW
jgi:hypothetical protein